MNSPNAPLGNPAVSSTDASSDGHEGDRARAGALATNPQNAAHFHLLRDVEVEITLEIGRRRMRIADVLKIGPGQVLELSKAVGEPLDIFVNGQLLGRGEAVVVGERYGVRITELVSVALGREPR